MSIHFNINNFTLFGNMILNKSKKQEQIINMSISSAATVGGKLKNKNKNLTLKTTAGTNVSP